MPYKIEIRPLAVLETLEAYDWYESQSDGLGSRFLDDLDYFYEALVTNPFTHSFYTVDIRQGALSKFPFVVIYEIFDNTIVVYSIFMTKQDAQKKPRK